MIISTLCIASIIQIKKASSAFASSSSSIFQHMNSSKHCISIVTDLNVLVLCPVVK